MLALKRVSLQPDGRQLGFPRSKLVIRWLGRDRLRWDCVRQTAARYDRLFGSPDILVLHAGEDDLGNIEIRFLIKHIKDDVLRLKSLFPKAVMVWSEIVNRHRWPQAKTEKAIGRSRIKVNKAISKHVSANGAVVVRHKPLEGDSTHLFEEDGIHLNAAGNDIWCIDVQEGIDSALQLWEKSQGTTSTATNKPK